MKQRIDRAGYYTVRLAKPGLLSSTQYVHRLLGFSFLENPLNKPMINHKDGNKLNNSIENLEWVTHSENMRHAYTIKLISSTESKERKIIDCCTGIVYKSIKEAAENIGINYSTLKNYLNGNRPNPTCVEYLRANAA